MGILERQGGETGARADAAAPGLPSGDIRL
jgi:hypothetical protein